MPHLTGVSTRAVTMHTIRGRVITLGPGYFNQYITPDAADDLQRTGLLDQLQASGAFESFELDRDDLASWIRIDAQQSGGGGAQSLREVSTAFDYTRVGAIDFGALTPGDSVVEVQVIIDVAFDDAGAMVSIGLTSDPDGILTTSDVDPTQAATYGASANVLVTGVDSIRLKVFPMASTRGSGRVVVLVG